MQPGGKYGKPGRYKYLQVLHGHGVGGGEAEQAQDLEHLDGGDQAAAALPDDVSAGHDRCLPSREGSCHAGFSRLHHRHLRRRSPRIGFEKRWTLLVLLQLLGH